MTSGRVVSARSTHPVPSHALGQIVGEVLDRGVGPDFALLVAVGGHAGALEDAASAVRTLVAPDVLVGVSTADPGLVPDGGGDGLGLWVASCGPVEVVGRSPGEPPAILPVGAAPAGVVLALACTRTVDPARFLAAWPPAHLGGLTGGFVTGGAIGDVASFVVDGHLQRGGSVTITFPAGAADVVRISPWVPVGPCGVVTAADELGVVAVDGGRAADLVDRASDLAGFAEPLALGVVLGDRAEPSAGDHQRRRMLAADDDRIRLDAPVPVGTVVQVLVRRPTAVSRRLERILGGAFVVAPRRSDLDPFGPEGIPPELVDPTVLGGLGSTASIHAAGGLPWLDPEIITALTLGRR